MMWNFYNSHEGIMMKQKFLHCAAAVFFGIALIAGAGERTPLPEKVLAHVAVERPRQFLDNVFSYVEKVTEGTERPVSKESLDMLSVIFLPAPFDVWDAEKELNFVVVGDGDDWEPVFVFSHGSFEGLLEGLGGAGWEILDDDDADAEEEEGGGNPFAAVRSVTMPSGGGDFILADIGDGRAVLAESLDAAKLAARHEEWEPADASDADLFARVRVDDSVSEVRGEIAEAIAEGAEEFAGNIADAGLSEEAGRWMLRMAEKYGDLAGMEIEQAREARFALSFDGARADLGVGALLADGAWTTKFARALELEAAGAPEEKVAGRLPEGHYTVNAVAALAGILPDAEVFGDAVLGDFAELVPEKRDALIDGNRASMAAGPGGTASAGYFNDGNPYSVSVTEFRDPQAALDAALVFFDAAAAAAEKMFGDPEAGIRLSAEKVEEDGREWHEVRFEPRDGEAFAEFVEEVGRSMPGFALSPDFRIYMARTDGALVALSGAVGREVFTAVLEQIGAAPADAASPLDAPELEDLLGGLGAAQAGRGVLDLEQTYLLFGLRMAGLNPGMPLPEELNPAQEAFMEAFNNGLDGGAEVAFGFGAEDGCVMLRTAVPAEAVNVILKKYERHMAAESAAYERLLSAEDEEDAGEEAGDAAEEAEEAAEEDAGE